MPEAFVASYSVQCEGKHTYHRKHEAKLAARRTMAMTNGPKRGRIVVYRCPWCGSFHLGHPPSYPRVLP